MTKYTYYVCLDCGWDSVRNSDEITGFCPICAEDNGREGDIVQRPALPTDGRVEGRDDREGDKQ